MHKCDQQFTILDVKHIQKGYALFAIIYLSVYDASYITHNIIYPHTQPSATACECTTPECGAEAGRHVGTVGKAWEDPNGGARVFLV